MQNNPTNIIILEKVASRKLDPLTDIYGQYKAAGTQPPHRLTNRIKHLLAIVELAAQVAERRAS